MTPGARLAAAAEILDDIFARRSAADRTIANWGRSHRFAGAKDRAAIAARVYTVLRRRNECAHAASGETPRALVLGSMKVEGLDADEIDALCTDGQHAIGALTTAERRDLDGTKPPATESWIRLNYPEWLHEELLAAFGGGLEREIEALNGRAPLDLRVNTLKADREAVLRELTEAGLTPERLARVSAGLRLPAASAANVTRLAAYKQGRVEVQDEGSQLAVLLAGARPMQTVIDLAAGGGGKSLALAAAMENRGRILACDVEPLRLRQMEPRIARAGAKIVEIVGDPYGGAIAAVKNPDLVFIDAPCSGTGTWRRNPEAKWTLDESRLANYRAAQARLLDRAVELAGAATRIVYAVCSVLPSECAGQIESFCRGHPAWTIKPASEIWRSVAAHTPPAGVDQFANLTPARAGTDGFFVAVLDRRAS